MWTRVENRTTWKWKIEKRIRVSLIQRQRSHPLADVDSVVFLFSFNTLYFSIPAKLFIRYVVKPWERNKSNIFKKSLSVRRIFRRIVLNGADRRKPHYLCRFEDKIIFHVRKEWEKIKGERWCVLTWKKKVFSSASVCHKSRKGRSE